MKQSNINKQGFKPGASIKFMRLCAKIATRILGINGKTRWGNEFIQAIGKETAFNNPLNHKQEIKVVAGHGRLFWRYKETPKMEWETNQWINNFERGSIFFDIGSNVGIYSLIASQSRNNRVVSFELDPINASIQHKNIYLNNKQEQITLLPIGLSDKSSMRTVFFKTISEGDALHSIDEISPSISHENRESTIKGSIPTFKLDELIDILKLPKPKYVKIDVDGAELKILSGMKSTLRTVQSAMIEVDDSTFDGIKNFMAGINFEIESQYPVHGNAESCRNVLFKKEKEVVNIEGESI